MALVGFSVLRAAEQGRMEAELQARRNARAMAQALRSALQQPAVLAAVPDEHRFAVTGATLALPAEVGWLRPAEATATDPVVGTKLTEAQRAEFVLADATAARQQFDDLLGERGPRGDAGLPVLGSAAFQAMRAGDAERCQALLARLEERLRAAGPADCALPAVADAVAQAALLHATSDGSLPAPVARLLPFLPEDLADPLLDRLQERGLEVARLRQDLATALSRRARLQRVDALLALTPPAGPTAAAGELLLWFPTAGAGALCAPQDLLAAVIGREVAGVTPVPDLAEVVVASATPAHGEEVVPGLLHVQPRVPPPPGLLAGPSGVAVATAALALVFLLTAFLGHRALRREADAVRARADFLTVVTHELKTPLASIRLLAEMLAEDRVPAGRDAEYYGLLAGEAARLTMLIENVLDLGRMERGERAHDLRACDLAQMVREAVALFRPLAERDGLRLLLVEGLAPAPALADRGALLQALLNVLDNGRKYAGTGGTLEVRTEARDGALRIAVRDHGPGVPAGERETIFARFRRGAAHRHGTVPGVGLGLHLARAIAERHGGRLVCASPAAGPGAEFVFTLPLRAEVPA